MGVFVDLESIDRRFMTDNRAVLNYSYGVLEFFIIREGYYVVSTLCVLCRVCVYVVDPRVEVASQACEL